MLKNLEGLGAIDVEGGGQRGVEMRGGPSIGTAAGEKWGGLIYYGDDMRRGGGWYAVKGSVGTAHFLNQGFKKKESSKG